jgi:S-DNA-T family DNA segregation ATPase FtsK/SpoIIIE
MPASKKKRSVGKTAGAKKRAENARRLRQKQQTYAIVLLALGILTGCMLFIEGANLWKDVHELLPGLFGPCAFLCPLLLIYIALRSAFSSRIINVPAKLCEALAFITLVCSAVMIFMSASAAFPGFAKLYKSGIILESGGVFGAPGVLFFKLFGKTGAAIIDILLIFVFLMLVLGITIGQIRDFVAGIASKEKEKREAAREVNEAEEASRLENEEKNEHRENIDIDLGPEPDKAAKPKRDLSSVFMNRSKPAPANSASLDDLVTKIAKFKEPEATAAAAATSVAAPTAKQNVSEPAKSADMAAGAKDGAAGQADIAAAAASAVRTAQQAAAPTQNAAAASAQPSQTQNAAASAKDSAAKLVADVGEQQKIYNYPPLTLLAPADKPDNIDVAEELRSNAARLVDTLKSFGVETRITEISRGPAVTRYELQPSAGVKISRITSLADDIALNLAASGVRIEAPIPNKAAVGIEVPNKKISTVHIREILESDEFRRAKSKLTVALGRDIAGKPAVTDIYNMPHVLIAGATGSGKSVCINSIIISLLYKSSPEEVKLLMVDPKIVELGCYNGIPHLLVPVVTEPRRAAGALGWAVSEMQQRYKTFAECGVRDIRGYHALTERGENLAPMPHVVIIIDELADLIMAVPGEVEDSICRLAQKARAAGMHLVIATQRPSVDVITGVIKANIPSRIAFAVSSQVDSRTIIDSGGAEKLLGRGDMLFWPMGAAKPTRLQGCFVSDGEVEKVIDFVKRGADAEYNENIIDEIEKHTTEEKKSPGASENDDDDDPMLPSAVECVIDAGMASTSLLQRRLKLGYARAARIIDTMEAKGYVGPFEGSKPRTVLITREQWLEKTTTGAGAE